MDFFDRQEHARRRTGVLVLLFLAAVVCIIGAIYGIAATGWQMYVESQPRPRMAEAPPPVPWWNPGLFAAVAGGVLLIVGAGTAYKIHLLSGGGPAVARMLGGRPIAPNSKDPRERRLLNVVEEMAVASGTPVPAVFVLENEQGINAFAAGYSPGDAAVAVTEGTMTLLTRDELQGVVAHEFSHVLNGDMRMNLRLLGVLHGILLIGLTGLTLLRMLRYVRSGKKSGGAVGIILGIGLTLTVIGFIGLFFGKLIKSAISRQREFLADAAAVQFTRNPDGIGGALKKIGGCSHEGRLLAANAEEASHLYIVNALRSPVFGWLSTHPPLERRIRAIDPRWDGTFPEVSWPETPEVEDERPRRKGLEALAPILMAGNAGGAAEAVPLVIVPDEVVSRVGTLTPEQVSYGAALLAAIPDPLSDAARDPVGSRALVYALLLDADAAVRAKQMEAVREDAVAAEALPGLEPSLASLGPESRLPLIDIALPALRQLDAGTIARFLATVKRLEDADGRTTLFEFTIRKILQRQLGRTAEESRQPAKYYAIRALLPETTLLLSALAHAGNANPDLARQAFAIGVRRLSLGSQPVPFVPREGWDLASVEAALDKFALAAPGVKRLILRAGAECVATDGTITRDEAELLRAIADTLDCPMPPFGGAPATA
jgi:Zn-dependent protease with chaperone function